MKKNNGITLVTLVVTILIITIVLGISINVGFDLLEKSRAGKMVTYMELIEARANAVYEDTLFKTNNKNEFENEIENFIDIEFEADATNEEKAQVDSNIAELEEIIVSLNYSYTYLKWNKEMLAQNGINKNILGSNEEYFIVAFDYNTQRVVGVYYNKGCSIDEARYYSLEDLRENISK